MEPIISPWIIYALDVFDKLYFTCIILMLCCGTISILMAIACDMDLSDSIMQYAKKLAIVTAICAVVLIIVPKKDTLIAMLAAAYITPDNFQAVQGNIIDFVKQIIEATK